MNPMFYFLLALTAVLAATSNASIPILDYFGEPLIVGRGYYALSDQRGARLTLDQRGDNECSFYVGLKRGSVGIIRFSNWKSGVGFVPDSENLNIEMNREMNKDTICRNSTYWRVASSEEEGSPQFIVAGIKSQSGEDSTSFFQIKTIGPNLYIFAYCPKYYVFYQCTYLGLYDISLFLEGLALTNMPAPFVFHPLPSII